MSKELIVVSTGSSINKYVDELRLVSKHIDILSWSFSLGFLVKNNIFPKFYSFIDPHSATKFLNYLSEQTQTTLLFFKDIVGYTYSKQQEYIGTSQMMLGVPQKNQEDVYRQYVESVYGVPKKNIPCTTIKKLKISGEYTNDFDDNREDFRFQKNKVIMGMSSNCWYNNENTKYMNMYQDKLTMCILPLCYYMGYTSINLLGFDGKNGRFFNSKQKNGQYDMNMSYKYYIPMWLEWKKYHNMDIFTLNNSDETVLVDHSIKQRDFKDLV